MLLSHFFWMLPYTLHSISMLGRCFPKPGVACCACAAGQVCVLGAAWLKRCSWCCRNLSLLKEAGADLVFFSPLRDTLLPGGISGVYLGGGYPERCVLWGPVLSA